MTQSMVMTRIGGHDYPMRSEPNCKTCQSPNRLYIEASLLRAQSYASIARSLSGLPPGEKGHPTDEGIAAHVKNGHVPINQGIQRRIIERRAKEIGRSVEDDEDTLADYVTVNQMIVDKGLAMLAEGNLELKGTDVIAASKFLHQVEQGAGGDIDVQAWIEAVMEYMEIAQKFIPPAAWQAYSAALQKSPVLKALADRQANTVKSEVAED